MKITTKENFNVNLCYHLLSHLKINHPANVYNKDYLEAFYHKTNGEERIQSSIIDQMTSIYESHFNELYFINFIGLQEMSLDELRLKITEISQSLSEESRWFLESFVDLISKQASTFKTHQDLSKVEYKNLLETELNNKKSPVHYLLKHLNKDLKVYLIKSLFNFGRGYASNQCIVGVLSPRNTQEVNEAIQIIIHELIHFITDAWITEEDNSDYIPIHERLVMVFQEALLMKLSDNLLFQYHKLMKKWDHRFMTDVKSLYPLNEALYDKIEVTIEEIIKE